MYNITKRVEAHRDKLSSVRGSILYSISSDGNTKHFVFPILPLGYGGLGAGGFGGGVLGAGGLGAGRGQGAGGLGAGGQGTGGLGAGTGYRPGGQSCFHLSC